jgi:septin 7
VHYENFRCRKLAGVAGTDKVPNKNPLFMMEEEQKEHVAKLNKMEREMEEVFERKVREKKQKLSDNERDLERRQGEGTSR